MTRIASKQIEAVLRIEKEKSLSMSMEYVNLGKTGLKVSRICLGCMSYGEAPDRKSVV